MCTGIRVSERTDEGRMVRFVLSFIDEGENVSPLATGDLLSVITGSASAAGVSIVLEFIDEFIL